MIITYSNYQELLFEGGINSVVAFFYIVALPTFIGTAVLVASGLIGGAAVGAWWFMVAGAFAYYIGDQLYAYLLSKDQYVGDHRLIFSGF